MRELTPDEHEMKAAKAPHDIFLTNLIANHILLFTAIASMGGSYFAFIVIVPILSFLFVGYTFYRAANIKREQSEFVYIHWQIAKRWSLLFSYVLAVVVTFAILGWVGYTYLGLMKELMFAFVGGLSFLPILISVLVLIVIEMDSLNHARVGTLPDWAKKRFLAT
jgi:hypothetical protein